MINIGNHKEVRVAYGVCRTLNVKMRVYLYLVDGLLIDTGPINLKSDTAEFLDQSAIEQVVLTHIHEDHSGMAHYLEEHFQVPIYLHPRSIAIAGENINYPLYRRLMWGSKKPFSALPMPRIIATEKFQFEAIEAPGHTEFHHVFYEKNQGWLFTGDLYLGTKQQNCLCEENMQQKIASLEKLLKLDFETIFCAHAGVVLKGKKKMSQKLSLLLELRDKVNHLRAQGLSDHEIDRKLYPRRLAFTLFTGGEMSSYNVIRTL